MLTFILIPLLSEGQAGEAYKPSNKTVRCFDCRGPLDTLTCPHCCCHAVARDYVWRNLRASESPRSLSTSRCSGATVWRNFVNKTSLVLYRGYMFRLNTGHNQTNLHLSSAYVMLCCVISTLVCGAYCVIFTLYYLHTYPICIIYSHLSSVYIYYLYTCPQCI